MAQEWQDIGQSQRQGLRDAVQRRARQRKRDLERVKRMASSMPAEALRALVEHMEGLDIGEESIFGL